jgi:ribonuclease Y
MSIGTSIIAPIIFISGVAFIVIIGTVMFFAGMTFRRKKSEKEIGGAKAEVERILADGEKKAESRRREILIEAKEEIHKTKVNL